VVRCHFDCLRRVTALVAVTSVALLALLAVAPTQAVAGDSPAGFWWGTDDNAPYPNNNGDNGCPSSSAPWLEPYVKNDGCGKYGEYAGEVGGYWDMTDQIPNCGGSDAYVSNAVQDAYDNWGDGDGVGPASIWFLGGPGLDPSWSPGNTTEAKTWGTLQGDLAAERWKDHSEIDTVDLPLFADVEDTKTGIEGWEGANPNCSGAYSYGSIDTASNRATFDGFYDAVESTAPPGVYASPDNWSTIMSGHAGVPNTEQWTADWGQNCGQPGPLGWTQTYDGSCSDTGSNTADWFGSVDADCKLQWQWASTNMTSKDYDQIDGNNVYGYA
jgi:hypothetical protein